MQFEIKLMNQEQIEDYIKLFIATFSQAPWFDEYESDEEVRNYFKNCFACGNFLGFCAYQNEQLIALSTGFKKPWLKGIEYYIDQFCVSYNQQGKGLGSKFLQEIEVYLEQNALQGIVLNTERDYPAFTFYKKNGFDELQGLVVLGKE